MVLLLRRFTEILRCETSWSTEKVACFSATSGSRSSSPTGKTSSVRFKLCFMCAYVCVGGAEVVQMRVGGEVDGYGCLIDLLILVFVFVFACMCAHVLSFDLVL